eukprot:scaffold5375_cov110-Isochrysis_galbana.AAC.1
MALSALISRLPAELAGCGNAWVPPTSGRPTRPASVPASTPSAHVIAESDATAVTGASGGSDARSAAESVQDDPACCSNRTSGWSPSCLSAKALAPATASALKPPWVGSAVMGKSGQRSEMRIPLRPRSAMASKASCIRSKASSAIVAPVKCSALRPRPFSENTPRVDFFFMEVVPRAR